MNQITPAFAAPYVTSVRRVQRAWIDYNGHMNMAFYLNAFDKASDEVFDALTIGEARAASERMGPFTLQCQIFYLRELKLDDPLRITFQLLDHDAKRMHFFMKMWHATENYLAATVEQINMNVDLDARKGVPYPPEALRLIEALHAAHRGLPRPEQVGQIIAIRRNPS